MSLCGINIMLFLFRIFKLLDFQPRVGILTRTIAKALDDLLHFAFVLVVTFIVYAMLGYVIFGPTIQVTRLVPHRGGTSHTNQPCYV